MRPATTTTTKTKKGKKKKDEKTERKLVNASYICMVQMDPHDDVYLETRNP